MAVQLIQQLEEWRKYQREWDEIFWSNPNHTPFQNYHWLITWWECLGSGDLFLLRVENEAGRAIGFAPFFIRSRFYAAPLRHLAFLGLPRADYLDFVVAAGWEAEFFDQVFAFLRRQNPAFTMVELKEIPAGSTNLPYILEGIGKYFPHSVVEDNGFCATIPLPAEWDIYTKSLGKRIRNDIRYDRRFLAKEFPAELREFRLPGAVRPAFADLLEICRERWDAAGSTSYSDPLTAGFEYEIAERLSLAGLYRLFLLYVGGKPAAGFSGMEVNRKFFGDIFVHSPRFDKYSVGNVLLGMVIEKLIQEGGLTELDLSRGNEGYKLHWGGREKHNLHAMLFVRPAAMHYALAVKHAYLAAAQSRALQNVYQRLGTLARRHPRRPEHLQPGLPLYMEEDQEGR